VVSGEMAFSYHNVYIHIYILTYKINVHSFASISKLRSGFAWLDYFMLTSFIPSWFHAVKATKKFTLVTTDQYMMKSPH